MAWTVSSPLTPARSTSQKGLSTPAHIPTNVTPICLVGRPNNCVQFTLGLYKQAMELTVAVLDMAASANCILQEALSVQLRISIVTWTDPNLCAENGDSLYWSG